MRVQPDATAAANVGLDEVIDTSRAQRLAAAGWAVERDLCSALAEHGAIPRTNRRSFSHAFSEEKEGCL